MKAASEQPPTITRRWACDCSEDDAARWLEAHVAHALATGGPAAATLGDVVDHFLAVIRRRAAEKRP